MSAHDKHGFTLIELLMVIAIIGILASVVLASLNTSRARANDAKVKAQLAGLRTAAELYYDTNSGYTNAVEVAVAACPGALDASPENFYEETDSYSYINTANLPAGVTRYCYTNGAVGTRATNYLSAITLPSAAANAWCIDYRGTSKQVTAAAVDTAGEVATLNYLCP